MSNLSQGVKIWEVDMEDKKPRATTKDPLPDSVERQLAWPLGQSTESRSKDLYHVALGVSSLRLWWVFIFSLQLVLSNLLLTSCNEKIHKTHSEAPGEREARDNR